MLCRKFELILIKIGFFMNFKICSKSNPLTMHTHKPHPLTISLKSHQRDLQYNNGTGNEKRISQTTHVETGPT